jgi:hypothetical protein
VQELRGKNETNCLVATINLLMRLFFVLGVRTHLELMHRGGLLAGLLARPLLLHLSHLSCPTDVSTTWDVDSAEGKDGIEKERKNKSTKEKRKKRSS